MKSSRVAGRPLFLFCSVFFLSSVMLADLSFSLKLIITALMLPMAIICAVFGRSRKWMRSVLMVVLSVGIAMAVSSTISYSEDSVAPLVGSTYECDIVIDEVRGASSHIGYYTARVSSKGSFSDVKIKLTLADGTAITGDRFNGDVTFYEAAEDEAPFLLPDGILLCGESEGAVFEENVEASSIRGILSRLNGTLSSRIGRYGGGEIASAVLLGDRDGLELSLKRDFTRLGISHLLALSGLHLSVIVALGDGLLMRTRLGKRPRLLLIAGFVIFYTALTGFSASVVRAGVMYLIKTLADLLDRQSDSLTNLSLAAFIILLADRYSCYDVGFILSVLAAYACVTYGMMKAERNPKGRRGFISRTLHGMLDLVLMTLWIVAITLPVMWKYFGEMSLISPITNIIFIPALTLMLYLAVIVLIFSSVPVLGVLSSEGMAAAEGLISRVAEAVSSLRGITVNIDLPLIGILSALLFVSCVMIPLFVGRISRLFKYTAALAVTAATLVIVTVNLYNADVCSVSLITRGKSEGLILSEGSTYTVIDVSDGSKGFAYEAYSSAKELGATEIEHVVLTHLHKKHVTAMADLTGRVIVRSLVLPSPENEDERDIANQLIKLCNEGGISLVTYDRDSAETVALGELDFSPCEYTAISRSTHPVIGFGFGLGGNSFAYAGGSWSESEDIISALEAAGTALLGKHHPKTKKFPALAVNNCVAADGVIDERMSECLTVRGNLLTASEDGYVTLPVYRSKD